MRQGMRGLVAHFGRIGIPASRVALELQFQSAPGEGGRQGLEPTSAWLEFVKLEALAAQQVARELPVQGIWSWGWPSFSAAGNDPDKPAAACVYLWARDPRLCDGPALAGPGFDTSRTEGQLALPSGVRCTLGTGRILKSEVGRTAALTGDHESAATALLQRAVLRSREPVDPQTVLAAERAIVRDRFGRSVAALPRRAGHGRAHPGRRTRGDCRPPRARPGRGALPSEAGRRGSGRGLPRHLCGHAHQARLGRPRGAVARRFRARLRRGDDRAGARCSTCRKGEPRRSTPSTGGSRCGRSGRPCRCSACRRPTRVTSPAACSGGSPATTSTSDGWTARRAASWRRRLRQGRTAGPGRCRPHRLGAVSRRLSLAHWRGASARLPRLCRGTGNPLRHACRRRSGERLSDRRRRVPALPAAARRCARAVDRRDRLGRQRARQGEGRRDRDADRSRCDPQLVRSSLRLREVPRGGDRVRLSRCAARGHARRLRLLRERPTYTGRRRDAGGSLDRRQVLCRAHARSGDGGHCPGACGGARLHRHEEADGSAEHRAWARRAPARVALPGHRRQRPRGRCPDGVRRRPSNCLSSSSPCVRRSPAPCTRSPGMFRRALRTTCLRTVRGQRIRVGIAVPRPAPSCRSGSVPGCARRCEAGFPPAAACCRSLPRRSSFISCATRLPTAPARMRSWRHRGIPISTR